MAGNANLGAAKAAKNDEFYTQWNDIENEMQAYLEYDPDVFRGKTVLLPCDDPGASNFTKYFALNFEKFGLKKLISTSYAPASNPAVTEKGQMLLDFALGEDQDEKFNEDDTWLRGRIYVLEQGTDLNEDGKLNKEDLKWGYLEGDVQFSVIGNSNAITYKEVFPLIKENRLWLGATGNTTDMVFRVPQGAVVKESDKAKAARLGYPSTETTTYTRLGNSCWFTNIEHGRRHEPLVLMTMDDNLIYGSKRVREIAYAKYENYNAIEVPETKGIPSDYEGAMGVPISFIDKYNPEQFEILGASLFDATPMKEVAKPGDLFQQGGLAFYIREDESTLRRLYFRLIVRHRHPETKES